MRMTIKFKKFNEWFLEMRPFNQQGAIVLRIWMSIALITLNNGDKFR